MSGGVNRPSRDPDYELERNGRKFQNRTTHLALPRRFALDRERLCLHYARIQTRI
jgi:hypothetical protein